MVVLSTFPRRKEAERVAKGLIEKRLAACCILLPNITSFFRWQGKQERAREWLLLIKTPSSCLKKVNTFLQRSHPYELPEMIGLPVAVGEESYLAWIRQASR